MTYALPVSSDTKPLPKQRQRSPHLVPWIVVGVVVIVALVASTLLVRYLRPAASEPQTPPAATKPSTPAPAPDADDDADDPEKEPAKPAKPKVPEVEVGNTFPLRITQWEKQVQISQKFGGVWYELRGDPVVAHLSAPLIDQLPEACADMRDEFGFTQNDDGSLGVLKPEATCDADPELYNEIWGLLDAAARTSEPL